MNNRLLLIALLLWYGAGALQIQAQTTGAELKKIRDAYLANKQLSFDVEVYSYSTKADKTPDLVSKGYMKKSDDKYYSNFNNYELMITGGKALIADRERKTLDYYEYETKKPEISEGYEVNIDSLIPATDSVVMRPLADGLKHFTCFSKEGYVRQTEIYVDARTHFIRRILYYYIDSTEDFELEFDRIEIRYRNIETKPVGQSFFSFDKYFKRTKSTFVPVGEYREFQMNYYDSKS